MLAAMKSLAETVIGIVLPCLLLAAAGAGCSREPAPEPRVDAHPAAPPGRAVVAGTAAPGTIVTLEPKSARQYPAPAQAAVMDQYGQQFLPGVLVAQVGQSVEFRSSEDVLHNVRVDEPGTQTQVFNVATPPFGSYTHTFDKAGYYNVSCDVHPAMRASIFVASTPYTAVADANGAFSIRDVEVGAYIALVFSGTPTPSERTIDVVAPKTELALSGG
jgi:plastocyanin